MGFFDLNIPYDTSQTSKTTRTKLVVKLMELGYTGVAYNHTIKGVMSDRDRCSIPLLSVSTLLNHLPPSLLSSFYHHRDLLQVPRSSPFRQYTRLTVLVDSPAQAHVINGGNPILKTYDLISVRPMSQTAFDHACEKSEVDVIAIDFSEKLRFRLKLPMVKAAIERGVYFEVTYSSLIADVQVRRQMISSAKLLVDWTRGKNLIFSSAALSVNELRGPYDVANLSSLLGLSIERAKEAISKNCRNLITNALRKRHFYKEAIRVEEISSDEKNAADKFVSTDWLKWDPISSGEGDLQLEDLAKSFSATTKVSKTVKPIDFSSIIDSIPSQGKSLLTATGAMEAPVTNFGFSRSPVKLDLLPESNRNSAGSAPSMDHNYVHESSQELKLRTDGIKCSATNTNENELKTLNSSAILSPLPEIKECGPHSENQVHIGESNNVLSNENAMGQTFNMGIESISAHVAEAEVNISSDDIDLTSQDERHTGLQGSDGVLGVRDAVIDENLTEVDMKDEDISMSKDTLAGDQQRTGDHSIVNHNPSLPDSDNIEVRDFSPLATDQIEEEMMIEKQEHVNVGAASNTIPISCSQNNSAAGSHNPFSVTTDALKVKEFSLLENDATLGEMPMEKQEHVRADGDASNVLVLDDDLQNNSAATDCMTTEEVTVHGQEHEGAVTESGRSIIFPSQTGNARAKQGTSRHPLLFPIRRLLYPLPFKRKAKKDKGRFKMG